MEIEITESLLKSFMLLSGKMLRIMVLKLYATS